MTDEELYQTIDEYSEEADALYQRIHQQVEASIVKHSQVKKRRKKLFTGIMSIAAVLIVTLAIVLPIVLQPQDQEIRYENLDALLYDEYNYGLKEYCSINNQSLLYLDWYEYAEGLVTMRYYEKGKAENTVYLCESYFDGNNGFNVQISAMKRNIVVESLDKPYVEYDTTKIDNTQITYVLNRNRSLAKFEYQGYKYYLEINKEITFTFLIDAINSMIATSQQATA